MRIASFSVRTSLKLLVAVLAIFALVAFAARDLAPGMAAGQLVLYAAIGMACSLIAIAVLAIVTAQWGQWVLRKGGTDAQWFWFRGEPPGLEAQRRDTDR
jgi:hypothetical protein